MPGTFRIATIHGAPIRIHFTFLLVLPFLAYLFGQVVGTLDQGEGRLGLRLRELAQATSRPIAAPAPSERGGSPA